MIKIISNLNEMHDIADEWNELAETFKTPLLRYEWFASCAAALYQPAHLRIIVSYAQGAVNGIAPLVMTTHAACERLEMLGQNFLNEPTGFLYKNEEALRQLMEAVIQMRKPLLFSRLRTESPEVVHFNLLSGYKRFSKKAGGSPFLEVPVKWDELMAEMKSDDRNHLRRKQKQLELTGKIRFEVIRPDPERTEEHLEEILRVEASGWKGEERTALLYEGRLNRFFQIYSKEAARLGILRFCFLRVDERAIAVQIAVEDSNRFWLLKVGYDEEWAKYSPGILLTHETIRYAFEQKLEGYEFLGHDAQWIHRWTRTAHSYVTVWGYPYSLRGIGALARDFLISISGKAFKAKG